ncbi:O-antigen ligase family protein [Microvirga alba]|uniref:O-antigen ligase family protein n=1 Tax=Microvirga alba TaxID=2791025 RepID=A0A931BQY5_9HYPH|nr:O-antigen ligase family protein [Microvirga alba]MBF9232120.1 O-antigen ligase family protein [Microvirga alba]
MSTLEMASSGRPLSGPRSRLAETLWRIAAGALIAMPVGMAIAHRSSPVFLVLSALCSLAALAAEGNLHPFVRRVVAALRSPLGVTALVFAGWSLLSVGWSEFRGLSLAALGEFWLPIACAFVVALALPRHLMRPAFGLLAGAIVAACFMMIIELRTGLAFRQMIGRRWNSFIFNRSLLTLLVLMPPLAIWLAVNLRRGWIYALALVAFVAAAMAHGESGASALGLTVACSVFVLAWFAPRAVAGLAMGAFIAAMVAGPFIGPISDRLIPSFVHERLAKDHSRERVDIWISFGAAIREQPILGTGFGVSPRMRDTTVAEKVPEADRTLLAVGHPHNVAIQIWTELGVVGAALALAIILLVVRAVRRQPRPIMSASFALMAAATAVGLVGHGAWQGWWAASLGAAITWMLAARKAFLERTP